MLKQSIAILAFTATIALPTTIAAITAMTPTPQPAKAVKSRSTQKIQVKLYDRSIESFSRLNSLLG
jgi:hypothetical protein